MVAPRVGQLHEGGRLFEQAGLWLGLSFTVCLYASQFFAQGGQDYLSPDGKLYVAIAEGEKVGSPINTRILKPYLAAFIASLTRLSPADAFRLLTPIELLVSLLLLRNLLRRRGGTPTWQTAVTVTLGCSLAVMFGHAPVLADPTLLMLTCLVITALDRDYLTLALILACLAALAKEYGVLLGFVWAANVYHLGYRRFAITGAVMPALALAIDTLTNAGPSGAGLSGFLGFLGAAVIYISRVLQAENFHKTLYIWAWSALWPLQLISSFWLLARFRQRGIAGIKGDYLSLAVLLIALPLLLTGDWDRSLLIVVPFACAASTAHPLAQDLRFAWLLIIGGVATALASPFFVLVPPPRLFTLCMIAVSLAASVLLIVRIGWFYLGQHAERRCLS